MRTQQTVNKLFLLCLVLHIQSVFGQTPLSLSPDPNTDSIIQQLANNPTIPADSLSKIFAAWNHFPSIYNPDHSYIVTYKDPYYGDVPMRLYIPKNYSPQKKSPMVLLLHGAVRASSFDLAARIPVNPSVMNPVDNSDLFFDHFRRHDYIILRPLADMTKKFDWIINDFNNDYLQDNPGNANLTYSCLIRALICLKKIVNIDDNRVFAFGHSDGADGVFGLEIFQPSFFAGFLLYNSMLANLKSTNNYIGNIQNFPTYIIHSDLDNLRPVEQITAIVDSLKKQGVKLHYEVYHGYKHFDDHLRLDMPAANKWTSHTTRNPFPSKIYWEAANAVDSRCSWLRVDSFNLYHPAAQWQHEINSRAFVYETKTWADYNYYNTFPGYAIEASYFKNTFTVNTSKIMAFEILISEKMVDPAENVRVIVNGKLLFDERVRPDKRFIASCFGQDFDREAIWSNRIKISLAP
jgi:predicted esterase